MTTLLRLSQADLTHDRSNTGEEVYIPRLQQLAEQSLLSQQSSLGFLGEIPPLALTNVVEHLSFDNFKRIMELNAALSDHFDYVWEKYCRSHFPMKVDSKTNPESWATLYNNLFSEREMLKKWHMNEHVRNKKANHLLKLLRQ
ncbi:hypothetical protein GEMRC1_007865 [Eukaryota sp. GEM-RC1]